MESRSYDPTLPLDFDGSSNMIDLPEVTLGSDPSSHDVSATSSRTMSHNSGLLLPNLVAKPSSGRMSPVRGRTMKEYDQQITDLKKENFSLKLRIYFLEERMQQKFGDGEDVFKTNIELKVNVQSLRKELEDKQELLRKASQAIETLTSSQQSDIDSVRKSLEEQHHKYTEELRSDLQKALQDAEDAREEVEAGRERISELEVQLHQLEIDNQQTILSAQKFKDAIDMKEREISALQLESDCQVRNLEDVQRQLQEMVALRDVAQQRVQQLDKDLQRRGRDVERLSTALKDTSMIDGHSFLASEHLQSQMSQRVLEHPASTVDVVEDQRENLGQLEAKVAELQDLLNDKDSMIGTLEDRLKEKDKTWKDVTNQLQQVTKELEEEKRLGARRDKTIIGLVSSLHKKEKEVASTKSRLSKSEGTLKTLKADRYEAEMASQQDDAQRLAEQLAECESSNRRLQTQLSNANQQVENMIKSLGKKEGELAGFREQLQQANQALKCSEEALENLQEQLEKERAMAHNSLDRQNQDYKRLVEDHLQQLEGKDSLLAHMTAQLRSKDRQLSALMDLLTDETNKGQKVLLQKLEDDLNRSSGSAQMALEEKQVEMDRKGRELREARQALQEKGRHLEQAQLQLLNKQEEMERLELRYRQQGEATAQLSNTLAKAQQSLEEGLERHARVLQERDAMVERLQKALAEKERMLEELTIKSPAIDKQQQKLRAQLREKDQLIQELQTDCVRASCEREQAMRSSQASLREKEDEIQALEQKQQKELLNRDQEIQQLTSRLSRQELQVEALQSRLNDAQAMHCETEGSMRRMLAEKDKTIESLVDSVGEKERLLRRSQQNLTEDAKAQMAEMDTLLAENSRLKRLLRQKEDSLQEELRQKNQYDNRETHHTSYHETVTHTLTADNAQVCRLLEEQIRETQALKELLRQDRHHQVLANFTADHYSRPSEEAGHSREEEGGSRSRQTSSEALHAELCAVSVLRQRLQEGLERSHQLHRSLLGYTARHADHFLSGENTPDADSLPRSLNALRIHQQQQQQQDQQERGSSEESDGCPGVSSSGGVSGKTPVWRQQPVGDAFLTALDNAARAGEGKSNLATQTTPFLTHTLLEHGGPLSWEAGSRERASTSEYCFCASSGAGAGEGGEVGVPPQDNLLLSSVSSETTEGTAQRERSKDSMLSSVSSVSLAELAGMSAPVLRDLVSQLQEDLIAAVQHNAALTAQMQEQMTKEETSGNRMPLTTESDGSGGGGGFHSGEVGARTPTAADLQEQMQSVRETVQLKEEETERLRQHLGLTSDPVSPTFSLYPTISPSLSPTHLHNQAHNLQHQVKDMNKMNSALKQHLDISRASSRVRQDSGVSDSQQVVAMALEIERLKEQNTRLSAQVREYQDEHRHQEGNGGKSSSMVLLSGKESCNYNRTARADEDALSTTMTAEQENGGDKQPSNVSLLSGMSLAYPSESFLDDLSHNTNRYSESALSQHWGQLSQSEAEWVPRLMQGERSMGDRLPSLARLKLGGKECSGGTGGSPIMNVSRRLQESQEQVKSLEDRLTATEGTVRYMSQRLRYYRSLLHAVKTGADGVGGVDSVGVLGALGLPRSQSESCLLTQSRLSLSLSCSDLREATQSSCNGSLAADYSGSANMSGFGGAERGGSLLATGSKGQKSMTPSKSSILKTLSQHISAMRERYPPGMEVAGKPRSRAGNPQPARVTQSESTRQEEDGGSNISCASSSQYLSQEMARQEQTAAHSNRDLAQHVHRTGKSATVMSDTNTNVTVSGSEWTHSQATHSSATLLSRTSRPSLSPQEITFGMTLGEDVLDGTALDNLTYSSFSESILPMGGGHRDSAWGLPIRAGMNSTQCRRTPQQAETGDQADSQLAENTEGGSSGDEVTCDGNRTLLSNSVMGEGSMTSCTLTRDDSTHLKARVMVLSDMNRTLREELRVYDTLCRSLGVQVSPELVGQVEGNNDDTCDGEMRLLQLHLAELKRLRARLEQLDTDAYNAMQVTSLLNSQRLQHITELESALAALRNELAQERALSEQRHTKLTVTTETHEREVREMQKVREQQDHELQLLRDNLAVLQDCEVQRTQQHEVEVEELQQHLEAMRSEAEEARQRVQEMEEELEECQQRRQSFDARFSQSQHHMQDLEGQLLKAKRRTKALEAELHKAQLSCQDLQSQLSTAKTLSTSLDDKICTLRQSEKKLESELKESKEKVEVLETRLSQSEKTKAAAERELGSTKERLQSAEEEVGKLVQQKEDLDQSLQEERKSFAQQKEELCRSLEEERKRFVQQQKELRQSLEEKRERFSKQEAALGRNLEEEREKCQQLQAQLLQARADKERLDERVSRSTALQEECRQQQQRAQHYQERMAHYEQCMRDYQHRVHDCEAQVEQLRSSLQSSQSREQDAGSRLHVALAQVTQLQAQLKEAEGRAYTSDSLAHRADTLARTLENRLREMEVKVKEAEERTKESEYELRVSHTTTSELSIKIETLHKEAAEKASKIKKRDAQLKKLVEEYKRAMASQKEMSQLNSTLKTEIKLYETLTSKTEVSGDKKEELMKQLLSELSQTRRLAEDLISRLEHSKRNHSPASTAGPEAADGRPSPELKDSPHSSLSDTNILRVLTSNTHCFTATDSQSSVSSEHSDTRHMESTPVCTPFSSPAGSTSSGSGSRSKTTPGGATAGQEREASVDHSSPTVAGKSDWLKEVDGRKGVEGSGPGHLRSYSHPSSLKYWRDHPLAALSGSSGQPRVEVDSDLRRLFAISGLEGYEKLKRENSELLTTLSAMQARMADRLKAFTGISISEVIKSVEYSTLRELQMSAQNLRICAEEEGRLLSCFWLTQLPPINPHGEFYDPKLAEENESLKVDLHKQRSRYDHLAYTVREQQERLHATNTLRKKWENTLYKQLLTWKGGSRRNGSRDSSW